MQPLQQLTCQLPEELTLHHLQQALSEKFDMKSGRVKKTICRWYDTFDWRLFRAERILTREGLDWILQDLHGRELHRIKGGRKIYRFADEFPDSPLQEELAQLLSVRALLELGIAEVHTNSLSILNQDKKRVVQLETRELVNRRNGKRLATVCLQEIRGYGKWLKKASRHLAEIGIHKRLKPEDGLLFILAASGRKPLDYSSGCRVSFDPLMKSRDAAVLMYNFLLTAIRSNEQGVIDDIDSEFLHDLRVAVRRTRSALTLMNNVLDPEIEKKFKKEFKYIGGITGPVRDLDVYLLSRDSYTALLPGRLRRGLDYFFDNLAERRRRQQRKLVHDLQGPHYQQILTDWEKVLNDENGPAAGKNGAIPIGELAGKIIHKRLRKVLRDGKKIHGATPDAELHRLRIECKKLRYSLEFFVSLYDQQQMKRCIKQLKMLQDNLGDFNDLSVQQKMLADLLSRSKPGTVRSRELAASIGGLLTGLFRQHQEVRTHFEQTFAHFSRKKNLALYHALFDK